MRQSNYEMCMIKLINLSSLLRKSEEKGELHMLMAKSVLVPKGVRNFSVQVV